jgi:hypothetical protein
LAGRTEVMRLERWDEVRSNNRGCGNAAMPAAFPLAQRTTTSSLNLHVLRAAINYKFDWGGPVVARY